MTYPNLPASLSVDGMVYAITEDPSLGHEDGEFNVVTGTIRLRPGMALGYARSVLVHEWLHALWEHGGLTADESKPPTEEMAVSALAYRALESLRANPQLVAFLVAK